MGFEYLPSMSRPRDQEGPILICSTVDVAQKQVDSQTFNLMTMFVNSAQINGTSILVTTVEPLLTHTSDNASYSVVLAIHQIGRRKSAE